jgi:NAD(P)-dependent dehydrogenase (short-subunit alcohol dehydrogenase family)
VYALCRNPAGAAELAEVAAAAPPGSVSLHAHDQDSAESCAAVATEFAGVPLDTLINNAGVGGSPGARSRTSDFGQEGQQFGSIDYAAWADTMNTNVLGVMRTVEALTPSLLLNDSPRLVHICGVFGSLTNQVRVGETSPDMAERSGSGGYFIYRSSKAAMNMVAKMLDVELAPLGMYITRMAAYFCVCQLCSTLSDSAAAAAAAAMAAMAAAVLMLSTPAHALCRAGVASLALHPGGVQTRLTEQMGKYAGSITAELSVGNMRGLIETMTVEDGLAYQMHDGRTLQW